jgi:hypothetical protein
MRVLLTAYPHRHGFLGTFYVNPGREEQEGPRDTSHLFADDYKEKWARQVPQWQQAAARGHEVRTPRLATALAAPGYISTHGAPRKAY